jgi:hypothetical protein
MMNKEGNKMNERIKDLAEQAGFIGDSMYPIFGTCQQTALNNFAELIVRECIDCLQPLDKTPRTEARDFIREHFGVE